MVGSLKRKKSYLHVLLFHPWEKGFKQSFNLYLIWLRKNGYQSIDPETLADFLSGKELTFPSKSILLTFDDGTLETYQVVFPMMKKFGFKGIAFVITTTRLVNDLDRSWWREVDQSGWLRIECHSHSHGLVFKSPQIINFYKGDERDDYFLLKGTDKRLGGPIYRFGYELVHRRFYPEKRISNLCMEYVRNHGRQDFFKKPTWRKDLLKITHPNRRRRKAIGFYEGQRGWETRIGIEISRSKRMIEETIGGGKKVLFFAYPWGAYDNKLIHQLKRAGYRGAFTSGPGIHYLGEDPYQIKRIPIPSGMRHDDLISILKQ